MCEWEFKNWSCGCSPGLWGRIVVLGSAALVEADGAASCKSSLSLRQVEVRDVPMSQETAEGHTKSGLLHFRWNYLLEGLQIRLRSGFQQMPHAFMSTRLGAV